MQGFALSPGGFNTPLFKARPHHCENKTKNWQRLHRAVKHQTNKKHLICNLTTYQISVFNWNI